MRQTFAWVGVLVVALMQVSVASHQFEHLPSDLGQSCEVCVQQDKSGDALLSVAAATIAADVVLPVPTDCNHPLLVEAPIFHHSRAPPLS